MIPPGHRTDVLSVIDEARNEFENAFSKAEATVALDKNREAELKAALSDVAAFSKSLEAKVTAQMKAAIADSGSDEDDGEPF